MQKFRADEYRGMRVRLSGWLKTEDVGEASLWMRVDDERMLMLAFDNMSDRKIRGSSDWREQQIVLNIPKNSAGIFFGVSLTGVGMVWVDDIRIDVVDKGTKSTNMSEAVRANRGAPQYATDEIRERLNRTRAELNETGFQPLNTDFER